MSLKWNDLFLSGSIIDLHTSVWRARVRIRPVDLGIEDSDAVAKALALGFHRLAPASAFEQILEVARAAKRSTEYHSVNFGMIVGARFVPKDQVPILLGKLSDYRSAFDLAVKEFVANYDAVKDAMLPVIEQALSDAARTPEAARVAVERIRAEYPTAEEVGSKFSVRWNVYAIDGAKSLPVAEAAKYEADNVREAVRQMMAQLREECATKVGDVLALINRGGVIQQRSIQSAGEVIARIEQMNIFGDDVLDNQLRALRRALSTMQAGEDVGQSTIVGLETVKQALTSDIADALANAEETLTGVGRRKLAV